MLLWTISSQAIATLGLRSACAAGFKHRHPVAIAEDGLCALFGLPYVISCRYSHLDLLQGTFLSSAFVMATPNLVACITDSMRCRVTCYAYPDLNKPPIYSSI